MYATPARTAPTGPVAGAVATCAEVWSHDRVCFAHKMMWWPVVITAPTRHRGFVDRDLRSFAVPNLLITDGSPLPTQGAANPALTILALAARAADQLVTGSRAGLASVVKPL